LDHAAHRARFFNGGAAKVSCIDRLSNRRYQDHRLVTH